MLTNNVHISKPFERQRQIKDIENINQTNTKCYDHILTKLQAHTTQCKIDKNRKEK